MPGQYFSYNIQLKNVQAADMVGRKKSPAWKVFKKVTKKDKTYVICGLCEVELSYSKDCSTGTMNKHLKGKHPDKYAELYNVAEPSSSTATPSASNTSGQEPSSSTHGLQSFLNSKKKLEPDSPKAQALTRGILHMLCVDLQPLSFTEDTGFRGVMKTAEPRYVIPSRKTFRDKLIPELYQEVMTKLKRELNAHMTSKSSISITTDAWTSSTAASYITYTIHIIKADFTMASYNLGTSETKSSHTADHLKKHIYQVLTFTGILQDPAALQTTSSLQNETFESVEEAMSIDDGEDQAAIAAQMGVAPQESDEDSDSELESDCDNLPDVPHPIAVTDLLNNTQVYITTDNASNISKAVSESEFQHVRCFAHTVNLSAQKGLNVAGIKRQLARVRKVVKYFRKSNRAKYALEVCIAI